MTKDEAILTIIRVSALEDFAKMLKSGSSLMMFGKDLGVPDKDVMFTMMNSYSKGIAALLTTAQDLLNDEDYLQFEREAMNIMFKAKEKVS